MVYTPRARKLANKARRHEEIQADINKLVQVKRLLKATDPKHVDLDACIVELNKEQVKNGSL